MAVLITQCVKLLRGIEYTNFTGAGNALILTEDTRISINRSPYGLLKAGYHMFITPKYTYSVEEDTTVFISNEIVPDFYVVNEAFSSNDVVLSSSTESASIIGVADPKEITIGEVAINCTIDNATNHEETIVVRIYSTIGDILLHTSDPKTVLKNARSNIVEHLSLDGVTIPAEDIVYFTLESSGSATVEGSVEPSHIKLTRKNL